jgi:arylsulfatase
VHEGGISTPLVVQWPKGIAARGELRHSPGHLVDVVPTVIELATGKSFTYDRGTDAPKYPGKSLVPSFRQDVTIARDSLWFLHEGNRALRVGDWKIVAAGKDAPWELYDVSKDRSESKNVAGEKPEKVRELAAQWDRETGEYKKWAEKDAPVDAPAEKAARKKKNKA